MANEHDIMRMDQFHIKAIGKMENMTEKVLFIIPKAKKFIAANGIMEILPLKALEMLEKTYLHFTCTC